MKFALIFRSFLVAMVFGSLVITFQKLSIATVLTPQEISVIAIIEAILLGMASFIQLKMDHTSRKAVLVMLGILALCEATYAGIAFLNLSHREYILYITAVSFIAGPLHIVYQYGASKLSAKYVTMKVTNFIKYFAGIFAAGLVSLFTSLGLGIWDVFPYAISGLVALIGLTRIIEIIYILKDTKNG